MTINVTRSSLPAFEEYCEEIRELWDSRWLTNNGVKHKAFSAMLKAYLDTPCLTLFANGHLALENILEAMKLPKGGEVITTPFTFASTTHAIVRSGLKPVFCDINDRDYTIDVTQLESLITPETAAILPVHVYGNLCDTDAIASIARRHGLRVIYDAAHAFGVRRGGVSAACFGDASMFSFHATKVFHTVEGGAVCYADSRLEQPLNDIKNFGIHGPEDVLYVGGNAKMNELQAAMGICNLRHIDDEIKKRGEADRRYRERLSGVRGIKLCEPQPGVQPNYAYFPVVFDGYRYTRDEVAELLKKHDIAARKYFYPLTNSFACYSGTEGFEPHSTPVAADIAQKMLTLPLFADLSIQTVDRICDIILK